jgi:dTDP-glucose 4,6-dehydratase/UDP-glucose 4-epimerase
MKILIVGSKGFIGSHALSELRKKHDVWGCDVFTDYNEKNYFIITAQLDFNSIFFQKEFDVCINASGAANVSDSLRNPGRDFELNVHNVFLILEAIRTHCPTCKFLNLSSAAVYGNPDQLPVREIQSLKPLSPYGYHKMQAEQLCAEYYKFFNVGTCSLRIFSAYGPGLKKQILWDLYLKSQASSTVELFGTGEETRDYVYVDDIVEAIKLLIEKDTFYGSFYNVASGKAQRLRDLAELFLQSINWAGNLKFTKVKRSGDPDFWQADISKIGELGFAPKVSIQEGIKRYAQWLSLLV